MQHPMSHPSGSQEMRDCIQECTRCHNICLESVTHCLEMGGEHARPDERQFHAAQLGFSYPHLWRLRRSMRTLRRGLRPVHRRPHDAAVRRNLPQLRPLLP